MILILGGTSDSINICNKLNEMNLPYMVSVTTEYGRDIAKKATDNVFLGKLTIEDMISLIASFSGKLYGMRSKTNKGRK